METQYKQGGAIVAMEHAKPVSTPDGDRFIQPNFWGPEAEQPQETQLDNCLVLAPPVYDYDDTDKRREWTCTLHAEPSIFHPDTDIELIATASNALAAQTQRKSLKPGDRVVLTGIMREDTLALPTGERKTVHCLALTQAPQMVVREKRVSTTAYELRRIRHSGGDNGVRS